MGVEFYTGRAGTGKTAKIQSEIIAKLNKEPSGDPVIYLVPEQMTFQAEKKLITGLGNGMIRGQVLSFSRLAFRILQERGGAARPHIDKTGIHMLLRSIIEKNKVEFRVFKKASSARGFIDKMEQMLVELTRYSIEPETLKEEIDGLVAAGSEKEQFRTLTDKLYDIYIVYSKAVNELKDKYLLAEDYLGLLAEKIPSSSYLKGAEVYIDGFHSFTPVELTVIKELITYTKHVKIALTADTLPENEKDLHPLDLFYETESTFMELLQACEECCAEDIQYTSFSEPVRFLSPGLKHLEAQANHRPASPSDRPEGIKVVSAVNKRAEVEYAAREILALVRDSGYRFNDIAVLLRNPAQYADYFELLFHEENIPFFMDNKNPVLNHPLIEFIRSFFESVQKNWRYEAVFRMLKTEMLFPEGKDFRERLDRLENYVLAYGIQGDRWYNGKKWRYSRFATTAEFEGERSSTEEAVEREINETKDKLLYPVIKFQREIKKAETVEDYCRKAFELLEEIDAPSSLELLRDRALENGNLREAREHEQLWNDLTALFDQMAEISGDEKVSLDLFVQMLEAGLDSMTFSIIPPALDQVVIADMETSRLTDIKAAFIMGVNDGILPAKPDEGSIITEEERVSFEQRGIKLAPGAKRQLLNENFIMYTAQAVPEEHLYLTYAIADVEGKSLQPSMFLNYIYEAFPSLRVETVYESPAELPGDFHEAFITTPAKTLSFLTIQMQRWKKGYSLPGIWRAVYNWYAGNPLWRDKAARVLGGVSYKNIPQTLPIGLTEKIYGQKLKTSISRLEKYNACPFSQFASYGLRLRERETFKLEAPDIGTLFHAALKEMAESLRKDGKDFSHLSEQEAEARAAAIVSSLAPKIQREILLSSSKFNYLRIKLQDVVTRASVILAKQAVKTGFSPAGLEVGFGDKEQLPPLTFDLESGQTIELVGRIDRVDKAESGEGVFVRIIDYKSSSKDIKLDDVYYGLALQMLVYLDVVVSYASSWLGTEVSPAGVLYFHVHNPVINSDEKLTAAEIEDKIFKDFKMKGLISSSSEAIRQMDLELEQGQSDIVPVGLKKDGNPYSASKVISPDKYELLRHYLRKHITEAGEAILKGDISLSPFKKKQHIPCTYCAYKSFCQFDPVLETNNYRILADRKAGEILEMLETEGGRNGENSSETR